MQKVKRLCPCFLDLHVQPEPLNSFFDRHDMHQSYGHSNSRLYPQLPKDTRKRLAEERQQQNTQEQEEDQLRAEIRSLCRNERPVVCSNLFDDHVASWESFTHGHSSRTAAGGKKDQRSKYRAKPQGSSEAIGRAPAEANRSLAEANCWLKFA